METQEQKDKFILESEDYKEEDTDIDRLMEIAETNNMTGKIFRICENPSVKDMDGKVIIRKSKKKRLFFEYKNGDRLD